MQARCTFYGVGQGLCYGCEIVDEAGRRQFCFAYDCGTLYQGDHLALTRRIGACRKSPKGRIDALFISHFDRDHISAVPALLDAFEIERIFIPHFTPAELGLLALATRGEADAGADIALYEDPAAFFAEMGCKSLYIVHPPREQRQGEDRLRFLHNDNMPLAPIGDCEVGEPVDGMQVWHCYGAFDMSLWQLRWQFRIYQDQDEKTQEKLRKEIEKRLPAVAPRKEALKTLLRDKGLCDQAGALYRTVKNGINQSSLVLYHAPAQGCYGTVRACPMDCGVCWDCCVEPCGAGTLLTGDINLTQLKNKGDDLEEFLSDCPQEIGVFLLPHHGSGKNLSVSYLEKVLGRQRRFFPCSYGRGNRFKHPDAYLLDKLMLQAHGRIVHVVRDEDFCYSVHATEDPS